MNAKKYFKRITDALKSYPSLPSEVRKKVSQFYIVTVVIIIIGIFLSIIEGLNINALITFLGSIFIAFLTMSFGLAIQLQISKKGIKEITGICISHKQTSKLLGFATQGDVKRMVIETENEIISIPVTKQNEVAPINTYIKVYLPANTSDYFTKDGVLNYNTCYGYEILPHPKSH